MIAEITDQSPTKSTDLWYIKIAGTINNQQTALF